MKLPIEPLSQRDSRWASTPLGFSSSTIGQAGCTITALAMMAGLDPAEVNARLKSVNGFAASSPDQKNLIIWAKIKEAIPQLEFEWRGYTYDNERVKKAIEAYGACLVEVDYDGKITTPNDRHWVLYIGNQRMIDPWTGVEKSTGWYPLVKGFAIIKTLPETIVEDNRYWIYHRGQVLEGQVYETNPKDIITELQNKLKENDRLLADKTAELEQLRPELEKQDEFNKTLISERNEARNERDKVLAELGNLKENVKSILNIDECTPEALRAVFKALEGLRNEVEELSIENMKLLEKVERDFSYRKLFNNWFLGKWK